MTRWKTAIALICFLAGLLSFGTGPTWRTFGLMILLFWQGNLYLAAPLFSLLSLKGETAVSSPPVEQGKPMLEELAARWVSVMSMLFIAVFSLINLLPSPAGLPDYTRFLPVDISPRQLLGEGRTPSTNGSANEATNVPESIPAGEAI